MPTRTATALPFSEFPVAVGNFDSNRAPITMIVLHSMAGYLAGTRALFATPPEKRTGGQAGRGTCAHYGIGLNGVLDHYLEEYLVAYHAGDYTVNRSSIGIETEDNAQPKTIIRTNEQYDTLIKLVADIAKFYNIPLDRDHIKKHNDLSATTCPGNLDVDKVIEGARRILGLSPTLSPTPPNQVGTNTGTASLNIRMQPDLNSAIIGKVGVGERVDILTALSGVSVAGNNKWYRVVNGFIWSGGVELSDKPAPVVVPVVPPTPNVFSQLTVDPDVVRAGTVIKEALPVLKDKNEAPYGNAEGAAREMVVEWNNLITSKKNAKGLIAKLGDLFGV